MKGKKIHPKKEKKPEIKEPKNKNNAILERLKFQSGMIQTRSQRRKSQNKKMNKGLNYLWIVFFVKKFVDILKMKTVETKLKRMETYHRKILDDATFFKDEISNNDRYYLNNPIYNIHVLNYF